MALYMHTLDGQPASYFLGSGVCFTNKSIKLATSLRQIRREQKITQDDRRRNNLPDEFRYGYVTIRSPAAGERNV